MQKGIKKGVTKLAVIDIFKKLDIPLNTVNVLLLSKMCKWSSHTDFKNRWNGYFDRGFSPSECRILLKQLDRLMFRILALRAYIASFVGENEMEYKGKEILPSCEDFERFDDWEY